MQSNLKISFKILTKPDNVLKSGSLTLQIQSHVLVHLRHRLEVVVTCMRSATFSLKSFFFIFHDANAKFGVSRTKLPSCFTD